MATVLIIDSDAAAASALKDALNGHGVENLVTGDGTEGLGLAKTAAPACIILCVELNRVSGYSICNKLKKDPTLASIPLVLTSSQATEETFEQHKKLKTRADAYLKKPYELDQILSVIAQFVPELASGGPEVPVEPVEHVESVNVSLAEEPTEHAQFSALEPEFSPSAPIVAPVSASVLASASKASAGDTGDLELAQSDDAPIETVRPTRPLKPAPASSVAPRQTSAPLGKNADDDLESLLGPVSRSTAPASATSAPSRFTAAKPQQPTVAPVAKRPLVDDDPLAGLEATLDNDSAPAPTRQAVTTRSLTRESMSTTGSATTGTTKFLGRESGDDASIPSSASKEGMVVDEMDALLNAPSGEVAATLVARTMRSTPIELAREAAPTVTTQPPSSAVTARRTTTTGVGPLVDAQAESLRNENKQLRQRLQAVEQTLQQKEIEFNDRLLQESSRSRESVELKKRLTLVEREVEKFRQTAEAARAEADEAKQQLSELQDQLQSADSERQALSDKLVQVVDKVKAVVAERDELQAQLEAAGQNTQGTQAELEQMMLMRDKAKKAVDIALQLLDETGLVTPP